MRHILLATAAAVVLSGAAFAAAPTPVGTPIPDMASDPMHGLYGNTMTVTGPEAGQKWQYLFQNDKSYVMLDTTDHVHRGTWSMQGSSLCLTPTAESPTPPAQTTCHGVPQLSSVGDIWSYRSADGKPFTAKLDQGAEAFLSTGSIDTGKPQPEAKKPEAAPSKKPHSGVNTEATSPVPGGTIAQ